MRLDSLLCAMTLSLLATACAGSRFDWDDIRSLKAGMTKDEVVEIVGAPNFVRSQGDLVIYVWSFANGMTGASKTVAIPFKNGKMVSDPNVPPEF